MTREEIKQVKMTNQEAIEILRDTPIDLRSSREDDVHTLYAKAQMLAIEALGKMDEIIKILDDTDFQNAESLNEIGEDKGYCEAIRAISLEADRKYRWFYD